MVRASHLDLYMRAVARVHSTFISKFSMETHKLKVMLTPLGSTKKLGKIPAGKNGAS
jgi:hypothetical protein